MKKVLQCETHGVVDCQTCMAHDYNCREVEIADCSHSQGHQFDHLRVCELCGISEKTLLGEVPTPEDTLTLERHILFALHQDFCARGLELMKKKNHDYSSDHPLQNFMVAESRGTCSAENGIINRIDDKLSRLVSVIKKGAKVQDESLQDTIIDVINYSVLLAAVIKYKERKK